MSFIITTDSCADMSSSFYTENNVGVISMRANFRNTLITNGFNDISCKEFYDSLRNGETSTTSQVTPMMMEDFLKEQLSKCARILHLGFSSGLSGSFNSALIARERVLEEEEYKDKEIEIIDTKNASGGQGLIVYHAVKMKNEGKSFEEVRDEIKRIIPLTNSLFTVEDLHTLKRGGRISAISASVGTILAIKPVLFVDSNGKLAPLTKAKGRKKAMSTIIDYAVEMCSPNESKIAFIGHGDVEDEANTLKKMLMERTEIKEVHIMPVGLVIGSHTGPGVLSLHFIGKEKDQVKNV